MIGFELPEKLSPHWRGTGSSFEVGKPDGNRWLELGKVALA